MQHLYAPWRDAYIKDKSKNGCVFCAIADDDNMEQNRVLYKDSDLFIVMKAYPYTPGHFMVIPTKHAQTLNQISQTLWIKISLAVHKSTNLLKKTLNPEGVNLGMNIEAAAGAGIAEHLHYHVVPRWSKDTNFITAVGQTRVYSTDFDRIFYKLQEAFRDFTLDTA